jgi:ABC-type branched-subunit amino acid transport system ATPase component
MKLHSTCKRGRLHRWQTLDISERNDVSYLLVLGLVAVWARAAGLGAPHWNRGLAVLLSVEHVSKALGGRPVVRELSVAVERGEHLLLLGPSGSGKSTLINMVCGLLTPDAGNIRIAGEAIDHPRPSVRDAVRRRRVGLVFQTPRLVEAIDVTANLLLAQKLAGKPKDRVRVEAHHPDVAADLRDFALSAISMWKKPIG